MSRSQHPLEKSTEQHPDLTLVVVNFNGRSWLEQLLPGLECYCQKQSTYSVNLIVVDNASTDDSLAFLAAYPWIQVIRSSTNGGFAYGNNLALAQIKARYVCLLNTDTTLPETAGSLDILVDYLDKQAGVAVITPRVELPNGRLDQACHRGEPTPWASFTYLIGLEACFPHSTWLARYHQGWSDLSKPHIIDACTGAAMMVRTAAMETVGLLDERFFMYGEDLDWCRRFREAGHKVVFHPGATVVHHKYQSGLSGSSSETRQTTKTWFYKSMLLYYDKHNEGQRNPLFSGLLRLYCWLRS